MAKERINDLDTPAPLGTASEPLAGIQATQDDVIVDTLTHAEIPDTPASPGTASGLLGEIQTAQEDAVERLTQGKTMAGVVLTSHAICSCMEIVQEEAVITS